MNTSITKKEIMNFMMENPNATAEEILYHDFNGKSLAVENYKREQKKLPLHERDENTELAEAIRDIMCATTVYLSATDITRRLATIHLINTTPNKVTAMLKSIYGNRLDTAVVTKTVATVRKVKAYSI